jgi:hypothetical protein
MDPWRVTIHCSDSRNGIDVPAAEIRKWHLARGFSDIGYHLVLNPSGQVETGRPLNVQGAHVEEANSGNIGICLVGRDKFTPVQWQALHDQLRTIFLGFSVARWELHCHREFPSAIKQGKTCPNMEPSRVWAWYFLGEEKAIEPYILTI